VTGSGKIPGDVDLIARKARIWTRRRIGGTCIDIVQVIEIVGQKSFIMAQSCKVRARLEPLRDVDVSVRSIEVEMGIRSVLLEAVQRSVMLSW